MNNAIQEEDLIKFLKENIEPYEEQFEGKSYRASVTLTDGTFLPCVIFRNSKPITDLAIKRFKEESNGNSIFFKKNKGFGLRETVKSFVISSNNLNSYNIAKVSKSDFAIPMKDVKKINGETAMSWIAFIIVFKDGRKLSFGTSWSLDFFSKPDDYDFENIEKIISGAYLDKNGNIVFHKSILNLNEAKKSFKEIHREKPFFICYLDYL